MRTWPEDHPKARLLARKQEAILVAAKALFLRHGYADTTMEMVAAHAGVSIMTLYRHFRGKDVLFEAVIQHLCHQKAQEGREMLWQGTPAEVLRRLGQLRLTYLLNPEEIALYQVILGAREHFPEVGRMYYHLNMEKALDRLSVYLQELDRQGALHIPDSHLSAQLFLTLLQGQIMERARLGVEPAPTSEELAQHIDTCVTFFLAAHTNPCSQWEF
ncbi:MAG: TetR/AcrR family transcriptional regulator [Ktedonobacteraceae bacterium]|nr:TetR/AcrR family transcriptional regulator [Ktedonobacteraceae bacterium]MBO0790478.1 TetR/AcrR family transcriptional regulator [Ktedonobacteraceae bacterium]